MSAAVTMRKPAAAKGKVFHLQMADDARWMIAPDRYHVADNEMSPCLRASARRARRATKAFRASARGNVAMIFALSLMPIAIAAGAGLDLSRALVVRARLAEALDAAGLAVGATKGLTTDQMTSLAQNISMRITPPTPRSACPPACRVTHGHAEHRAFHQRAHADHADEHRGHQYADGRLYLESRVGPDQALGVAGARQYRLDVRTRQLLPAPTTRSPRSKAPRIRC